MKFSIVTKVAAALLLASLAAGASATPSKDKDKDKDKVKDLVTKVFEVIKKVDDKNKGPDVGKLLASLDTKDKNLKFAKFDDDDKDEKKVKKQESEKHSFTPTLKKTDDKYFGKSYSKDFQVSFRDEKDCEPHQVPEPAPLVLIGSALLALGVFRRKLVPAA